MADFDTDVLVVGAGPTGLMAAAELARHGVAYRLVDEKPSGVRNSRALTLHARTLEILQILGLADTLVRRGYPSPGINVAVDTRNPAIVEMHTVDTRYPYVLILSQAVTEQVLEEHLERLGGKVERRVTLTHVEQDDAGVTAQVRHADGRDQILRVRYLIDCGGAHSTVLRQLRIPWTGGKYEATAMLADAKITGEYTKGFITSYAADRGVCLFLPFADEYVRIIALDFSKQDVSPGTPLDLADLQESVDAIAPVAVKLHDARWLTHFQAPHRVVDRYRTGRLFLAGDAAHLFIPAGGQGMNTGMQDAFNLAWKLALVLAGRAGDDLLDSYHEERHAIGRQTLRVADTQFRIFLAQAEHASVRRVAPTVLRRLLRVPGIQRRVSETLSQIGLNYRQSPLSRRRRDPGLPAGAVRAGDRLPDADVTVAGNPGGRLYDLLAHGGYTLYGYVSPLRPAAERTEVLDVLRRVANRHGRLVHPCLIAEEGIAEDGELPVVVDVKRQIRTKLGAVPGSILLVRPDAYVAFHTRTFDDSALTPWLPSVFH